jgi:protein-S-isoprenylcysteine O-methyltransferase Ste14
MKIQALLLVVLQFVLFALLAGALLLLPDGQVLWVRLLGGTLAFLGLLVIAIGILTHFWINNSLVNVSPEPNGNNQLVAVGIYKYIRHPIYTGVILGGLGAALVHGHSVALLLALVIAGFFTYKSTFEERWLMQVYPAYAQYRTRAGRFWPKL